MKRNVYIRCAVWRDEKDPAVHTADMDAVSRWCVQSITALLEKVPIHDKEIPVCFGSAYGVLESLHAFDTVSVQQGALGVSPTLFPSTVLNAPACHASIRHQLTGPLYNFSNGAASALDALGYAYLQVSSGYADEAIACAAEAATRETRLVNPALKVSNGGAVLLTSQPGAMELLEYQFGHLDVPGQGKASPYGCVEPMRELEEFLRVPGNERGEERVLTAVEGPRYSSVTVRYQNIKDGYAYEY